MQSIPAWLWPAAGWTLLAAAAWLWFAWRLSRQPGRWCRKCHYDMKGIPSLTCPECGHTAKSERYLKARPPSRTRRAFAILLVLCAWPVANLLRTTQRGPVALIPGWLLVYIAPLDASNEDFQASGRVSFDPRSVWALSEPAPPSSERLAKTRSILFLETWRRLQRDELWDSSAKVYLHRAYDSELPFVTWPKIPARWPKEEPYHTKLQYASADARIEALAPLRWKVDYTPESGEQTLKSMAVIGKRTYTLQVISPSIDVSASRSSLMKPITSDEANADVGKFFSFIFVRGNEARLMPGELGVLPARTTLPHYGSYTVRVLLDNEVIGTATGRWTGAIAPSASIEWKEDGLARALAASHRLELELVGDAASACRLYIADWSGACEALAGTARFRPYIQRFP